MRTIRDEDTAGQGAHKYGEVKVIAETEKAIRVENEDGEKVWVPKSQVHDDSEAYKLGDEGLLIVTEWYAEKQGWG